MSRKRVSVTDARVEAVQLYELGVHFALETHTPGRGVCESARGARFPFVNWASRRMKGFRKVVVGSLSSRTEMD